MENNKEKICPVCNKPYEYALKVVYNKEKGNSCEHDSASIGPSKVDVKRKENATATAMARRQAAEFASQMPQEEMVTIAPPSGDTGKRPEVVPKVIVDSIQSKINNNSNENG